MEEIIAATDGKLGKNSKTINKAGVGGGRTHERIGYIDALKGFGIICVVIGHIALGYTGASYCPGNWGFWYAIENIMYSFHMPLFFMISGFVYFKAYFAADGEPKYCKIFTQVLNLVTIYVVFAVGFTLLKMPFNIFSNEKAGFDDIIWMWMRPVGVYWYLYVLIEMYLVFSIPGTAKIKPWLLLLGGMGLVVVSYNISAQFSIPKLLYYLIFFATGIILARENKIFFRFPVVLMGFVISVALSVIFWNADTLLNGIRYVNVIIAAGFVSAIWYGFEHFPVLGNSRCIRYIGMHSLEIYVMHSVAITAARTFLNKLNVGNPYVCLIANLILGIGLPLWFSVVMRKFGLFDWVFRFATVVLKNVNRRHK